MKNNMVQTIFHKLNLILDTKFSLISLGFFTAYDLTDISEGGKFLGMLIYVSYLIRRWYLMEQNKGKE